MNESLWNFILIDVQDALLLNHYARFSNESINDEAGNNVVHCNCCTEYGVWRKNHPLHKKKLQEYADQPFHYRVYPDKQVVVVENNEPLILMGKIYSTKCTGKVFTTGYHPYKCEHCNNLLHGSKSSPLLRKYNRTKRIKNPKCDHLRATKKRVAHKFCSVEDIEAALSHQSQLAKIHKENSKRLSTRVEELFHMIVTQLIHF